MVIFLLENHHKVHTMWQQVSLGHKSQCTDCKGLHTNVRSVQTELLQEKAKITCLFKQQRVKVCYLLSTPSQDWQE